MNDRYLCRAKRKDNVEWVEGNIITYNDRYFIVPKFGISCIEEHKNLMGDNMISLYAFEVDPSTICQCTGLKDKNGKLICENDIVKHCFGEKYAPIKYGIYQNCFDSQIAGHCGFYVDWPENVNMRKDLGYWINMVNAQVVGNVFDNPELLEVGE